ncbi:MAG TPA: ABC transporter ATP-binding protein [Burkholderiales bacterium]|nr:ABC transporter ATP-binding protein [Burkholderiales bacterium]
MPVRESTAVLRITRLEKRYGKRLVLAGVDLDLAAGESLGLVGLNGAGKTTLIKCLLDLCGHDSGAIELFGLRNDEPRARQRLAYVPERFMPPHYLLCREFLGLMLSLSGGRYERERARVALVELELDAEVLDRPVRQLSKGMTQKLGLAACFLLERDLYVLDEPMSGLDPASRVAVKSVLHRLKNEGRALLITSHVLSDVEELCSSVAVLDRGMIRFRGTPAALCDRYAEPQLERAFLRCIRDNGEQLAGRA